MSDVKKEKEQEGRKCVYCFRGPDQERGDSPDENSLRISFRPQETCEWITFPAIQGLSFVFGKECYGSFSTLLPKDGPSILRSLFPSQPLREKILKDLSKLGTFDIKIEEIDGPKIDGPKLELLEITIEGYSLGTSVDDLVVEEHLRFKFLDFIPWG